MDIIDLYATEPNIKCKDIEDFFKIKEKSSYKNIQLYSNEKLNEQSQYVTLARFEYEKNSYYLKITSNDQNALYTYVDMLLSLE